MNSLKSWKLWGGGLEITSFPLLAEQSRSHLS